MASGKNINVGGIIPGWTEKVDETKELIPGKMIFSQPVIEILYLNHQWKNIITGKP